MHHTLPSWVGADATYFVTINALKRGVNHFCREEVGDEVLASIQRYQEEQKWFCSIALLMPDHVHLIISMSSGLELSKTIGAWKRWVAKAHALEWQRNFFEHRLRGNESADEKRRYIEENPVRARLVEKPEDWPWVWSVPFL